MGRQEVDLNVRVGTKTLRNPIFLAPGPLGRTPVAMKKFADAGCAVVSGKTLTAEPKRGNPLPHAIRRLSCDWMINAAGGPNIGIKAFAGRMEKVRGLIEGSEVLISVAARTIEEFVSLSQQAEAMGADILDLDISCPNATDKGAADSWQKDLNSLFDLIVAVKKAVKVPLWIKCLSAYGNLLEIAKTVEMAGADAVVPLAMIGGLPIDINTGKPILGFKHGVGLATGPPLKYVELKAVADVARVVKIPVIATGGCTTGRDVIEFLMVGARGVQVLTAFMRGGTAHVQKMISEMTQFMQEKGWNRVEDLIGLTLKYLPEEPFASWYR